MYMAPMRAVGMSENFQVAELGNNIASPRPPPSHSRQILEWTQKVLRIGEAFSGAECTVLRDALSRQSGRFFEAWHGGNMLALHSMLDSERWNRLPVAAERYALDVTHCRSSSVSCQRLQAVRMGVALALPHAPEHTPATKRQPRRC